MLLDSLRVATLLISTDSTVPVITPDFGAPFFKGVQMVASWILALGLLAAFIAFVLAVAALVFKGFASAQMRASAGVALPWVIVGIIVLSGANGVFAWLVGLDFGFGMTFGKSNG